MERLTKFALLTYASLSLLIGWICAAVAFLFLGCGIVGAVVGHALWSFACRVIARAAGRLERHTPKEEEVGAR